MIFEDQEDFPNLYEYKESIVNTRDRVLEAVKNEELSRDDFILMFVKFNSIDNIELMLRINGRADILRRIENNQALYGFAGVSEEGLYPEIFGMLRVLACDNNLPLKTCRSIEWPDNIIELEKLALKYDEREQETLSVVENTQNNRSSFNERMPNS